MADGRQREVVLNLPGRFQADNVLVAAALTEALGLADVLDRLPMLRGVRGRMERAARLPNGAAAYVDYAHTPDALERLLTALRPHTTGRLHVVFGAGGDRDRGKRPLDGPGGFAPGRLRHRDRRQSAQRGSCRRSEPRSWRRARRARRSATGRRRSRRR